MAETEYYQSINLLLIDFGGTPYQQLMLLSFVHNILGLTE